MENNDNRKCAFINDYKNCLQSGYDEGLLTALSTKQLETFWYWFELNSHLFRNTDVMGSLESVGMKSDYGNCHFNAYHNSLISNLKLYCGFVRPRAKNISKPSLTHSFNVGNHKVYDYTYYFNQDKFAKNDYLYPFDYVGLIITNEFLNRIKEFAPELNKINYSEKAILNYPLVVPQFLYYQNDQRWKNLIIDNIEKK